MRACLRKYLGVGSNGKRTWQLLGAKFVLLSLLGVATLLPLGCGYTLNHRLKKAFTDPRGIFVPVFLNNSTETGAERVFTNALIRELHSRGEVVVSSREEAGYELKGVISDIGYGPTTGAYTDPRFEGLQPYWSLPIELGVSVSVNLVLKDSKTQADVWGQGVTAFRRVAAPTNRTYDYQSPSSLGLISQSLVEQTYHALAQDMMRDVYDDMVELF